MVDINLVPEEQKKTEDFGKLRNKLMFISVAILAVTAIGAIATLVFFSLFISQRQQLTTRVENASGEVNSYKAIEELIVVSKDKAQTAQQIFNSRINKVDVFTKLAEIIPQNVYFTDIKITQKDTTLNGRARSSADVAGLISALLSTRGLGIFSNVSINTLSADENGEYTFALSAQLVGQ